MSKLLFAVILLVGTGIDGHQVSIDIFSFVSLICKTAELLGTD